MKVRTGLFAWHQYHLAYELYGEGGTPCLLVHGILLDSSINRTLALRFASAGYQVALLDLLGHGNSDKCRDPAQHRVDLYAQQVCAALDHLGWRQAVIGGISLGAITALELAVQNPQRVLGLFLEMPVMERSTSAAVLILAPLMLATRYGAMLYRPFAHVLRHIPRPAPGRPNADWITSILNAASQEPEVISAILQGVVVGPVVPPRSLRKTIEVPALIIGHGGDLMHELSDAKRLARQLPHAHLIRARTILDLRTKASLNRLWPRVLGFLNQLHNEQPQPSVGERLSTPSLRTPKAPAKGS